MLAKVLLHELPPVREIRPEVPAGLDGLCTRMLAKDPDERPGNGAMVAEGLDLTRERAMAGNLKDRPDALGLPAIASGLDDLVSFATKQRFSPLQLLKHMLDLEEK